MASEDRTREGRAKRRAGPTGRQAGRSAQLHPAGLHFGAGSLRNRDIAIVHFVTRGPALFDRLFRSGAFALAAFASLASVAGCDPSESVTSSASAVVYGTDDRVDWFGISGAAAKGLARDSVVALIPLSSLVDHGATFGLSSDVMTLDEYITIAEGKHLCAGERFATQPTAAGCSGTLIGDDLVLTAGHCVDSAAACQELAFVFDYRYETDGTLATIEHDDVYYCERVVAQALDESTNRDFGIVQLDRPVVGRDPAPVRLESSALAASTPVSVIGFGTGLPLKYDAGGAVLEPRASSLDVFLMNTDTFAGNSGSGVFDANGTVVGILVSGQDDYVRSASNACTEVNVRPSNEAGESATYVFRAIEALCGSGYPDAALCPGNAAASCGDHFCTAGETVANCATDCAAPQCGDGVCDTSETCAFDCTPTGGGVHHHGHSRCSASPAPTDDAPSTLLASLLVAAAVVTRRWRR